MSALDWLSGNVRMAILRKIFKVSVKALYWLAFTEQKKPLRDPKNSFFDRIHALIWHIAKRRDFISLVHPDLRVVYVSFLCNKHHITCTLCLRINGFCTVWKLRILSVLNRKMPSIVWELFLMHLLTPRSKAFCEFSFIFAIKYENFIKDSSIDFTAFRCWSWKSEQTTFNPHNSRMRAI